MKGRVSMTQAEAQDFLNRRYFVQIRLWGDDPFSDDLVAGPYTLFGPASAEIAADPTGLRFEKSAEVPASKLDEDHEFAGAIDELYAGVRLLDPAEGPYGRARATTDTGSGSAGIADAAVP